MKKVLLGFFVSCVILFSVNTAKAGFLYTDVVEPVSGNMVCGNEKLGEAKTLNVLGLVSTGDAGVKAACNDGDIKQIHYIEQHTKSILCVFKRVTTRVYGN